MGLSTVQIAELTPFVFFEYKEKGFMDIRREDEVIFRKSTELNIMVQMSKNQNFDITKYWPIRGDEATKKSMTPEIAKSMMENFRKLKEQKQWQMQH